MLMQAIPPALADSAAVHDAAVNLGNSFAGMIAGAMPGLPANVSAFLAVALGAGFGLAASWLWHKANTFVHANGTAAAQASWERWWTIYGRWIGMLLSALITAWTTKNWAAALLPVLAHMPSAAVGGFSSTMTKSDGPAVSHGRMGALILIVAGGFLLVGHSSASAGAATNLVKAPTSCSGAPLPWLDPHRFVGTLAVGEGWIGPKATDHPVPYTRLTAGYQVFAPVQFNLGFARSMGARSTWRPTGEVRFIWAP